MREVEEETGLVCELGDEVAPARYIDGKGRRKEVRYWVDARRRGAPVGARRRGRPPAAGSPVDDAAALLTYGHDRKLLDGFVATFTRRRPS